MDQPEDTKALVDELLSVATNEVVEIVEEVPAASTAASEPSCIASSSSNESDEEPSNPAAMLDDMHGLTNIQDQLSSVQKESDNAQLCQDENVQSTTAADALDDQYGLPNVHYELSSLQEESTDVEQEKPPQTAFERICSAAGYIWNRFGPDEVHIPVGVGHWVYKTKRDCPPGSKKCGSISSDNEADDLRRSAPKMQRHLRRRARSSTCVTLKTKIRMQSKIRASSTKVSCRIKIGESNSSSLNGQSSSLLMTAPRMPAASSVNPRSSNDEEKLLLGHTARFSNSIQSSSTIGRSTKTQQSSLQQKAVSQQRSLDEWTKKGHVAPSLKVDSLQKNDASSYRSVSACESDQHVVNRSLTTHFLDVKSTVWLTQESAQRSPNSSDVGPRPNLLVPLQPDQLPEESDKDRSVKESSRLRSKRLRRPKKSQPKSRRSMGAANNASFKSFESERPNQL